ncbi:hypothetical protein Gotur_032023 [Gossypium turneri]
MLFGTIPNRLADLPFLSSLLFLKINSMVRFLKENNSTHLEMIHMKGIRDYVGFRSQKVATSLSQHLQMCLKKMAQNQTWLLVGK